VHTGFNLQLSDSAKWLRWKDEGDALFAANGRDIRGAIEAYVKAGVIDGGKLQSHWFSQRDADVFISHSHKDEQLAIAVAGWLHQKFGLNAFIDSCVWGYADDLQREFDNKYCKNPAPATTYDYGKRNRTTGHVHMMLSTALMDMIDRTECFIFLHTNESIVKNDVDTTVKQPVTTSPWIYAELAASRIVRKKDTGRARMLRKAFESAATDSVEIQYPAHLAHLNAIDDKALDQWGRCGEYGLQALDDLYGRFD
jgi:hypothetical protein